MTTKPALRSYKMRFDGALLSRGFWLYAWEIKGSATHHVYVGRTGDSSSPHAQSPFKRIGQHLDPSPKAKGNALGRRLREANVDQEHCGFDMVAIGPIFAEQATFEEHVPIRNQMAALERAMADHLKERGYSVLGTHPKKGAPDETLLAKVIAILDDKFPALGS